MPDDLISSPQLQFLNLRNLPARLIVKQAGWLLGFPPHQIPILVGAGLLKPLGQPAPNAIKYFAATTLCELKQDAYWQFRAPKEIMQYLRKKIQKKVKIVRKG
jgi:hypothetical protein